MDGQYEHEFRTSYEHMRGKILLKPSARLLIFSTNMVRTEMKVNNAASAGVEYNALGLAKKGMSSLIDSLIFELNFLKWTSSNSLLAGTESRRELWNTAARPKIVSPRDKIEAARRGEPLCRAISYASPCEALFALPLYLPLFKSILARFKKYHHGISIGCNRLGIDWALMGQQFDGCSYAYIGDYKRFDSSVPQSLVRRAMECILSCFDCGHSSTRNYVAAYRRWLEKNFYTRHQHVDLSILFEVEKGIPSGSIWTSVLGSVVNNIILEEFAAYYPVGNMTYFIYGDDHVILVRDAKV